MNELNHVTTDYRKQTEKPSGAEVARINNQLTQVAEFKTPGEFLDLVTQPNGCSWCPGIFDGSRKNENWMGSDIIALDFDDGVPLQDTLDKIEDPFKPNLFYFTFSHSTDTPKYRLVWFLDEFLEDTKKYKIILKGLIEDLGADRACKDPARFFYGGSTGEVLKTNRTPLKPFYHYAESCVVSNTYRERLNRTAEYDKDESARHNEDSKLAKKLKKIKVREMEDRHWDKLHEFDIISQFAEGRRDFRHPDVFLLATQMYWIRGGLRWMKKTMNKHNKQGKTDYTRNNFNVLRIVKKYRYFPQSLKESRFDDDTYFVGFDLFGTRGAVKKVNEKDTEPKLELKEAEYQLKEAFHFRHDGVSVIKTPPGLGKTEVSLEMLRTNKDVVLAYPTHTLKDEAAERLDEKGIDYITTPEIPEFKSEKLNNRLDRFFNAGLVKKAMSLIYDVAEGKKGSGTDMLRADLFRIELQEAYAYDGPVLTTHQKALHSTFSQKNIVFDEDPAGIMMEWESISLHDLLNLRTTGEIQKIINHDLGFDDKDLEDAVRKILMVTTKLERGEIVETPDFGVEIQKFVDAIVENGIHFNIANFLTSDLLRVDKDDPNQIEYLKRSTLPEDKTVLVMSASINTELYNQMVDGDVRIVDLKDVEHTGNIVCHTKKSYSQTSIQNSSDDELKELTDLPTITFNSHKDKVKNPVEEMHFFNTSGYDLLKGKDLAVVGTPHKPLGKYEMIAKMLGMDVTEEGKAKAMRKVTFNGLEFRFFTFSDERLQKMHLQDVEGELIQACGRSRALRCDCTVNVYSNFPLASASKYVW